MALTALLGTFYKFGICSQNALLKAELLRRELYRYHFQIEKYAALGPSKALEHFVTQTELIIHLQIQKSITLEKSAESQLAAIAKELPQYN